LPLRYKIVNAKGRKQGGQGAILFNPTNRRLENHPKRTQNENQKNRRKMREAIFHFKGRGFSRRLCCPSVKR
jgi:hypothetical protein